MIKLQYIESNEKVYTVTIVKGITKLLVNGHKFISCHGGASNKQEAYKTILSLIDSAKNKVSDGLKKQARAAYDNKYTVNNSKVKYTLSLLINNSEDLKSLQMLLYNIVDTLNNIELTDTTDITRKIKYI